MRRDLPQIVYANPALQVEVEHPADEPPSMQVHFGRSLASRQTICRHARLCLARKAPARLCASS